MIKTTDFIAKQTEDFDLYVMMQDYRTTLAIAECHMLHGQFADQSAWIGFVGIDFWDVLDNWPGSFPERRDVQGID